MSDNLYKLLEEALMVILILSVFYIDRRGKK
mgnify:CR=1 FL=1